MFVILRGLILACLVSLLGIPAALASGPPCLGSYDCQDPYENPYENLYPMQEEEPPPDPPPEEEPPEEEDPCNKYGGIALGAFLGYMGFLAGPTPLGAVLVIGGAVYSAYSAEECEG